MCGRYVSPSEADIEREWHIGRDNNNPFPARYNVTPQQGNPENYVPVIRNGEDGRPELVHMQWWLLPHWSKESRITFSTFNARTDKVSTAASYRVPFKKRRCIIPALGWFEWQDTPSGKKKWFLRRVDDRIARFAGLWDRWHRGDEVIESCTIIVGSANKTTEHVHDRSPVIIAANDEEFWLDRRVDDTHALQQLLTPPPEDIVTAYEVRSDKRPRQDDVTLTEPL